HVGDAVQMGTLSGEIREIGARATTIHTWDGADVIVPNSTLTSERVVNWTLSDRLRRVELEVGVAYEADPERVLGILRSVARAQPSVLAEPAPVVLCTGFGEGALKVQVRVWTSIDDTDSLLSRLVVAVHAALLAAKIEIALPQRAVHIRDIER
ncbi:MAG TPA: mechanosensitive ion channel domain-containing protein, partial [Methylomirabilota bacterium]|nr:mechanosensitive ion channel domain-containing protein [Methylomirabilota bacterium]